MYSGKKNQANIQSDLKSKARRASNILASSDKGRTTKRTSKSHEEVRNTVSGDCLVWFGLVYCAVLCCAVKCYAVLYCCTA